MADWVRAMLLRASPSVAQVSEAPERPLVSALLSAPTGYRISLEGLQLWDGWRFAVAVSLAAGLPNGLPADPRHWPVWDLAC